MRWAFLAGPWTALILGAGGCGGSSEGDGSPSRVFPTQVVDFFDATTVHPQARLFQLADYETRRKRVLFYPWGTRNEPGSVLLAYDTQSDFFTPNSYKAADLRVLLDEDAAQGFGGGFLDASHDWMYLVPFRKKVGASIVPNGLAVRFDLNADVLDPAAYQKFDVTMLPAPPAWVGWVTGVYAGGAAYFVPCTEVNNLTHGVFLRYAANGAFSDPAAWAHYDLAVNVHPMAKGFQSNAFKAPWLYLIPYGVGYTVMVRYNVERPFNNPSSYEVLDLAMLNPEAVGYTGAIVAGDTLVLAPWRDLSRPLFEQSVSLAVAFDTRKPLADPTAWSFFDLAAIHPEAKGYQLGWLDGGGFVHFVPTANFSTRLPPPFVVWDSTKPFDQAGSWTSYTNEDAPPCTGAAYDGRYAWMAPYGSESSPSGLIPRVSTR
ncbi:MAG: hypothetical protein HYY16_09025 [Planctomycetes bacterium]|nr:hypothetical protein [Planctomycetota bacterium]